MIIWEEGTEDISHPLEVSLQEADIGCNICGNNVAVLKPYTKILQDNLLYQKLQEYKTGRNERGTKGLQTSSRLNCTMRSQLVLV